MSDGTIAAYRALRERLRQKQADIDALLGAAELEPEGFEVVPRP